MTSTTQVPVSLVDRFTEDLQTRLGRRLQREGDLGDDELRKLADDLLQQVFEADEDRRITEGHPALGSEREKALAAAVRDRLFSFGPLQPYLNPGSGVSELNANGCDDVWVTYVDGDRKQVARLFETDEALEKWVERQARESPHHEYLWDYAHPFLEMDLPNGDRLAAAKDVVPRPTLSIRRHDLVRLGTLEDLVGVRLMDEPTRKLLEALVLARKNLIVSGGTAAGKTTLGRALANAIESWERIITVEDVAELRLERFPDLHDQVMPMRRRPPNSDGRGEVGIAQMAWAALRHNPDRVIVGEVRGAEVIPMLNAMTQGNDGSMCTVHANSAQAALRKLQSYASIAPERWGHEETAWMLRDAVHAVVHVDFDRANSRRYISSIVAVSGVEGRHVRTEVLFSNGPNQELAGGVGIDDRLRADLARVGYRPESLAGSAQ